MKKIYIGIALFIAIAIGIFFLNRPGEKLYPEESITHAHGLAVDVADPTKLHIATHHGLFLLLNDKELFRVGSSEDDYMGFSPHPSDSKIFFASGHPELGGNLGVITSEDSGFIWKKISNGVNGPVDFHAMAISPANPSLLYGWFIDSLQRSSNSGKNWELIDSDILSASKGSGIYSLIADPKDENVLYAATGLGLFVSNDKGASWSLLSEELKDVAILSFAINPKDPSTALSFTPKFGLAKSSDAGKTWQKINESFNSDIVYYIAYDKNNPDKVYLLTRGNTIYKSLDAGDSWSKIR